ncbi:MAG TPA: DUF2125 domain-containing protein [Stellaceae bacterium]|nr:DUF2125 domain-containing protein [Stellaceae bacterium]
MGRATRVGLAVAALLLIALAGGYAAFWYVAASRLEDGFARLAAALRPHKLELAWQSARAGGFPLALRVDLRGVELRDRAAVAASVTRLPRLDASAAPWNFSVWRLAAPDGIELRAGAGPAPVATASAKTATGSLFLPPAGGTRAWLDLVRPRADAGVSLAAQNADLWLVLPQHPPRDDRDAALGVAVDAWKVRLPSVPAPLRNPLDELSFGITVRGPVPTTPPKQAAAAWRDAGGTADIDHFTLRSGALTIAGSGTFALDALLQPEGSFSVAVEDYPALLQALVADGRLRQDEADLAGLALSLLAKPGPDGEPEIKTSLRMQHGKMFLGPVRIGPAPHIDW